MNKNSDKYSTQIDHQQETASQPKVLTKIDLSELIVIFYLK